jgi:hypothetical protein
MARRKKSPTLSTPMPNTGSEPIPPGATTRAADRPRDPGGGPPGSGAGPRHATNDPESPDESYEATDSNEPLAEPPVDEPDRLESGPPFAGPSGGAVGGAPAEGRSKGGTTHRGFAPGESHRGDSTIGAADSRPKKKKGKRR